MAMCIPDTTKQSLAGSRDTKNLNYSRCIDRVVREDEFRIKLSEGDKGIEGSSIYGYLYLEGFLLTGTNEINGCCYLECRLKSSRKP